MNGLMSSVAAGGHKFGAPQVKMAYRRELCGEMVSDEEWRKWQKVLSDLSDLHMTHKLDLKELSKEMERSLDCKFRYKKHMKDRKENKCEDCALKKPSFGMPTDGKMRWCKPCSLSHPGSADVCHKLCEDCKQKSPSFGLEEEGVKKNKKRWCATCAGAHAGSVSLNPNKCEDCTTTAASYGNPEDGNKRRWCAKCAKKSHPSAKAIHTSSSRCETCSKPRSYGLAGGKARWCAGCAKENEGAVNLSAYKCEDCAVKFPSFALPTDNKARWCGDCKHAHSGWVTRNKKTCLYCEKKAWYGMEEDGLLKWCKNCAEKQHPKAVSLKKKSPSEICELCRDKTPSFGLNDGTNKRRWCKPCADTKPESVPMSGRHSAQDKRDDIAKQILELGVAPPNPRTASMAELRKALKVASSSAYLVRVAKLAQTAKDKKTGGPAKATVTAKATVKASPAPAKRKTAASGGGKAKRTKKEK